MPSERGTSPATRVAVVGVGRFGARHTRVWREAGCRIVGLCDTAPVRLARVAQHFAVEEVAEDAGQLIERARPDVVVIASDEHTHTEIALTALDAGCHVFVEKPLALSSSQAWRIHKAAQEAGCKVVVGQISRFASPCRRMRSSLQAGRIGDLYAMRLRRDFPQSWFVGFGSRVHPVWESCIHDIDLAVGFASRRVARAVAMHSQPAGEAAPSIVASLLEFDGGVIATVESAWLTPDTAPQTISGALELEGSIVGEAELLGSSGTIHQRLISDSLVEWTTSGIFAPDLSFWPEEDGEVGGALRSEVEYALAVFGGRRANELMPLQEACWGVEAAEAIVHSLESGEPVDIVPRN